ncbi:hypothetical protein [Microbacterium sp.]|uniref:hypothetical protein n=1 Tax=Microbacterium sp. TaxID=51671 RepID=UPI0039E6BC21
MRTAAVQVSRVADACDNRWARLQSRVRPHRPGRGPIMSSVVSENRPWSRLASGSTGVLLTALIGVAAAATAFFRLSPTARGTVWAEDGALFLFRAAHPEQLTAWIFTPYDGYTHALPQLIGVTIWALVPIAWIGIATTVAACAVTGAVAAGVFAFTSRWNLNLAGRLFLAATTVLVPDLTFEVLGNLANLHWFLLWLTPFVLLTRARTWSGAVGLAFLMFVIGTSEIQSFLFAPLLLWHLRDRRRWPIVGGVLAAGVIQALALLGGSRDRGSRPSISSTIDGYFLQVPLTGLAGTGQGASGLVAHSGWPIAYAAAVPFIVCGVWFAWRSHRRAALVALIVIASGTLWVAGFAVNYADSWNYSHMDASQLAAGIAQLRYAVVPTMLLFALVGLAIGGDRPRRERRGPSPQAVGVLVIAVCTLLASFTVSNGGARAQGPTWRDAVRTAAETCGTDGSAVVQVMIAPAGWIVGLPCDSVTR